MLDLLVLESDVDGLDLLTPMDPLASGLGTGHDLGRSWKQVVSGPAGELGAAQQVGLDEAWRLFAATAATLHEELGTAPRTVHVAVLDTRLKDATVGGREEFDADRFDVYALTPGGIWDRQNDEAGEVSRFLVSVMDVYTGWSELGSKAHFPAESKGTVKHLGAALAQLATGPEIGCFSGRPDTINISSELVPASDAAGGLQATLADIPAPWTAEAERHKDKGLVVTGSHVPPSASVDGQGQFPVDAERCTSEVGYSALDDGTGTIDLAAPVTMHAVDAHRVGPSWTWALTMQSGTSMSTALTSGIAAMLMSADATLTPAEAKGVLTDTAVDIRDAWGSAMTRLDAPSALAQVLEGLDALPSPLGRCVAGHRAQHQPGRGLDRGRRQWGAGAVQHPGLLGRHGPGSGRGGGERGRLPRRWSRQQRHRHADLACAVGRRVYRRQRRSAPPAGPPPLGAPDPRCGHCFHRDPDDGLAWVAGYDTDASGAKPCFALAGIDSSGSRTPVAYLERSGGGYLARLTEFSDSGLFAVLAWQRTSYSTAIRQIFAVEHVPDRTCGTTPCCTTGGPELTDVVTLSDADVLPEETKKVRGLAITAVVNVVSPRPGTKLFGSRRVVVQLRDPQAAALRYEVDGSGLASCPEDTQLFEGLADGCVIDTVDLSTATEHTLTVEEGVDLFRCWGDVFRPRGMEGLQRLLDGEARPEHRHGRFLHLPAGTVRRLDLEASGNLLRLDVWCQNAPEDAWMLRPSIDRRFLDPAPDPPWGLHDGVLHMRVDDPGQDYTGLLMNFAEGTDLDVSQSVQGRSERFQWTRDTSGDRCGQVRFHSPHASSTPGVASFTGLDIDIGGGAWPELQTVEESLRDHDRGRIYLKLLPDTPLQGVSRLKTDRSVYLVVPTSVATRVMVPAGLRVLCAGTATRDPRCGQLGPLTIGVGPVEGRAVIQVEAGWGAVAVIPAPWEGPCEIPAPTWQPSVHTVIGSEDAIAWTTPPRECGDVFAPRCREAWTVAWTSAFEQATGRDYREYSGVDQEAMCRANGGEGPPQ